MPYKKFYIITIILLLSVIFVIYLLRGDSKTVGTNVLETVLGTNNNVYDLVTFNDFDSYIKDQPGTYSYYIKSDFSSLQYNGDYVFYAASLFKVPVAVATVKYLEQNDISQEQQDYIKRQLTYLLKDSNNDSQQYLIDLVGLSNVKNAFSGLGLNSNGEYYLNNRASSREIVTLFENLQTTNYISKKNREYIIDLMYQTSFDDRISVHLKPGLNYSHKIGNWPNTGNWHDCGIVTGDEHLIICLMSKGVTLDQFMTVSKAFAEYINTL